LYNCPVPFNESDVISILPEPGPDVPCTTSFILKAMPTNPLACSVELTEGVPETSISIIPFLKSDWLIFTNLISVFAPLSVTF
jgi:hypothetical protein